MSDVNSVSVTGNLTRDPEVRTTAGGMEVLNCGICVSSSRKSQDGGWEDKPNFVDWTMFGRRAASVSRYLRKGARVALHGRLDYQTWQDRQTGQNHSKLTVVADEVVLMQQRAQQGQGQEGPTSRPTQPATVYDEDIPF